METIDYSKPITTRDGRPVKLWTTTARDTGYPVKGEYYSGHKWMAGSWALDGRRISSGLDNDPLNLINPPQEMERWLNIYPDYRLNIYPDYNGSVWPTREKADELAAKDRIACIKVKFKEGEGL